MSTEGEYLQTLSKHKHIYDFFIKTGELVNYFPHIRNEVDNAYRNLVDPYHKYNVNCGACVAENLVKVYKWHEKHLSTRQQ